MGRLVDNRFSGIQGSLLKSSTYNQTYRDYMLNTLQDKINSEFEYAFDVIDIKTVDRESGTLANLRARVTKASKTKNINLNCSEDDVRQIIFQDINYIISIGDMFYFEKYYWVVINTDNINSATASATVRKCNNILKFKYNNIDFSQICVIQEIAKNNMKVETETEILTPDSTFLGVVPYNNNTRKIPLNFRFLLGGFAYRISGIDSISMVGLIKLKLQLDANRPTDNFVTGYADNTGLVTNNYSINIVNGNIFAKVGDIPIQVNAQLLNNGVLISNTYSDFIFSSSDINVCTIDDSGLLSFVGVGTCAISITYKNDNSVKNNINIIIEAVQVVDNYSINITGSSSIILNSQQTYTATINNNGVVDSNKMVTWLISDLSNNPTNLATIISSTNNSCIVKANNSLKGNVLLKATLALDSNINKTLNVAIKSAF